MARKYTKRNINSIFGRPKKYTQEFIEKLALKLEKYTESETIPFLKDFAFKNNVPAEEISRTCAKNEIFSQALKKLKDRQEIQLVKGALAGKLNPTMAIFTLKNVSGWRDTRELEVKAEQTINVKVEEIDIAERMKIINKRYECLN